MGGPTDGHTMDHTMCTKIDTIIAPEPMPGAVMVPDRITGEHIRGFPLLATIVLTGIMIPIGTIVLIRGDSRE
jgi:hypothetical protein